ncbi:Terminase-like family protein [anaerobic digester metagenome]
MICYASGMDDENSTSSRRSYPDEIRQAARGMYLRRYSATEISEALNVPRRTVYFWISQGQWDDLLAHEAPEQAAQRRLTILLERDNKTPGELKEVDALVSTLERLQKLRAAARTVGREVADTEPAPAGMGDQGRERKPRKGKQVKNDVSRLTKADFEARLHKRYFDYQQQWAAQKLIYRNRAYLKSRQIGATWYFAQEALEDAVLTGDNQIFLSATRAQSEVFRSYITAIAAEHFDINLTGNPIVLNTAHGPATLYFLSNNSKSAQSYHGHVYIDEFFWITKFRELFKVATGMAAHKKWRRTIFSTPSALTHEAFGLWSGEDFQQRFAKRKPWPDDAALRAGTACPDSWFRQIVTLDDAMAGGCDLFDLAQLKLEYSTDDFEQLFRCRFVDDAQSVFSLALLERCMVDTGEWTDIDRNAARPVGNRNVWGGYDPARTGDNASASTLLPPDVSGGVIRLLEKERWQNKSYLWQGERIREQSRRYNYGHYGVDTTGPGIGVYEMVKQFIPMTVPIVYSPQVKAQMVLKALEVMEQGRFQFDAGDIDLAHAFMTIKRTTTNSGQMTYAAGRTEKTGHADEAWSVMHALAAEPLARQDSGGCIIAMS